MVFFQKSENELNLDEGRMCLNFLNTMDWHASAQPEETLHTYTDLVNWAESISLFSNNESSRLLEAAGKDHELAKNALQKAVAVREAMFNIVSANSNQIPFASADLNVINDARIESLAHTRIVSTIDGFSLGWESDSGSLDSILWQIVHSIVELMVSPEFQFAKICADDRGCGWAFLDLSHNHNRRWCSMKSCGNRAKAQRHYQKVTSGSSPTSPSPSVSVLTAAVIQP